MEGCTLSMIPIVASAEDLDEALRFAQMHPNSRWYVAQRARALDAADRIPEDWGLPTPVTADAATLGLDAGQAAALGDTYFVIPEYEEPIVAGVVGEGEHLAKKGFESALHPRGKDGRFIEKGGRVVVDMPNGSKVEGTVSGIDSAHSVSVKIDNGSEMHGLSAGRISQAPTAKAHVAPVDAPTGLHPQDRAVHDMADKSTQVANDLGTPESHEAAAQHHQYAADRTAGYLREEHQRAAGEHRVAAQVGRGAPMLPEEIGKASFNTGGIQPGDRVQHGPTGGKGIVRQVHGDGTATVEYDRTGNGPGGFSRSRHEDLQKTGETPAQKPIRLEGHDSVVLTGPNAGKVTHHPEAAHAHDLEAARAKAAKADARRAEGVSEFPVGSRVEYTKHTIGGSTRVRGEVVGHDRAGNPHVRSEAHGTEIVGRGNEAHELSHAPDSMEARQRAARAEASPHLRNMSDEELMSAHTPEIFLPKDSAAHAKMRAENDAIRGELERRGYAYSSGKGPTAGRMAAPSQEELVARASDRANDFSGISSAKHQSLHYDAMRANEAIGRSDIADWHRAEYNRIAQSAGRPTLEAPTESKASLEPSLRHSIDERYEYHDNNENSHKFFESSVFTNSAGAHHVTAWGRTGAKPSTKVDTYGSLDQARRAHERKLAEKAKKGYASAGSAPSLQHHEDAVLRSRQNVEHEQALEAMNSPDSEWTAGSKASAPEGAKRAAPTPAEPDDGPTLRVANEAQRVLMEEHIKGQISDGMWENANHGTAMTTGKYERGEGWRDWSNAKVVVDPQHTGRNFNVGKDNYQLNKKELVDIVGDDMLQSVREATGNPNYSEKDLRKDLAGLSTHFKTRRNSIENPDPEQIRAPEPASSLMDDQLAAHYKEGSGHPNREDLHEEMQIRGLDTAHAYETGEARPHPIYEGGSDGEADDQRGMSPRDRRNAATATMMSGSPAEKLHALEEDWNSEHPAFPDQHAQMFHDLAREAHAAGDRPTRDRALENASEAYEGDPEGSVAEGQRLDDQIAEARNDFAESDEAATGQHVDTSGLDPESSGSHPLSGNDIPGGLPGFDAAKGDTFRSTGDPVTTKSDYARHVLDEATGYQESNLDEDDPEDAYGISPDEWADMSTREKYEEAGDDNLQNYINGIHNSLTNDDLEGAHRQAQSAVHYMVGQGGYADREDFHPDPAEHDLKSMSEPELKALQEQSSSGSGTDEAVQRELSSREPSGAEDVAATNTHELHGVGRSAVNKGVVPADEAQSRVNAILRNSNHEEAHRDLAKLMSEAKLGGKQRARYREVLNQHHGSSGTGVPAGSLREDNPLRDRLAAAQRGGGMHTKEGAPADNALEANGGRSAGEVKRDLEAEASGMGRPVPGYGVYSGTTVMPNGDEVSLRQSGDVLTNEKVPGSVNSYSMRQATPEEIAAHESTHGPISARREDAIAQGRANRAAFAAQSLGGHPDTGTHPADADPYAQADAERARATAEREATAAARNRDAAEYEKAQAGTAMTPEQHLAGLAEAWKQFHQGEGAGFAQRDEIARRERAAERAGVSPNAVMDASEVGRRQAFDSFSDEKLKAMQRDPATRGMATDVLSERSRAREREAAAAQQATQRRTNPAAMKQEATPEAGDIRSASLESLKDELRAEPLGERARQISEEMQRRRTEGSAIRKRLSMKSTRELERIVREGGPDSAMAQELILRRRR